MKKFFIAILAFLYIGTSTGAVVHLHYCMGELAYWGLGYNQTKVCGECGMDEKDATGCCKDEHTFIKNDDDQKIAENFFHFADSTLVAINAHEADLSLTLVFSLPGKNFSDNSPPRWNSVAVYLFKRTFLI
jgi:hypothetical protein